jgi:hypothetical protein
LIWLACFSLWANVSVNLLKCMATPSTLLCGRTAQTTSPSPGIFAYIWVAVAILLIPIAYGQVVWFLMNRANPLKSKIIWIFGLIISAIAIFFYTKSTYPEIIPVTMPAGPTSIIYIFGFLLLPALIFSYSTFILFIFEGGRFILGSLRSLLRFSRPIALSIIEQIIVESIKMNESQWKFSDLSLQEIRSIRQWAQQNLEINEKKNIPIAIMLTIAGLLVSTPPVQTVLNNVILGITNSVIHFFAKAANLTIIDYFGNMSLMIAITWTIIFFVVIWGVHLQNFAIQGAVVQVCIVAEYAKEQEEIQQKVEKGSIIKLALDWISKFL